MKFLRCARANESRVKSRYLCRLGGGAVNILERLTKIETQVETLVTAVQEIKEKIEILTPDVVSALDSTRSAHHRIDEFKRDVCWTIGMSTTLVGIFASVLTWALGR